MAIYLARSFAKTNSDLEKQIVQVKELSAKQIEQEKKNSELKIQTERAKAENLRKTKEMEKARKLQLSMLPKELPTIPNLDISAFMKTATEVGGDYYDFIKLEDNTLYIAIGDATGHGLDAGMMVSVTKGLFQNLTNCANLEEVFNQFNNSLYSMNMQPMYMTLRILKIKDSYFDAIGAGMYPFLIYRKSTGVIEEIESAGPPLGVFPQLNYPNTNIKLSEGDIILLMTDGFTERTNPQNEIIGDKRAKKILQEVANASAKEIIEQFVNESDLWGGDIPPNDDVTFVVIKIK